MICRCVIFGGSPGFVPVHEETALGVLTRYVPCPDCGGTQRVHCCEGERPCPEPEGERDVDADT